MEEAQLVPGEPEQILSKHIVTFLDVLGFTDRMRSVARDSDASQALLASYTSALNAALASIGLDDPFVRRRGFTDNVLLATELMASHPESTLGHTTMKVAQFQLDMVLAGWFVRGGISIGDFYMDDTVVFGAGLLDAYDLESKAARDPRVMLSQNSARLIRHFLTYYADPYHDSPQNGYVLVDSDGTAFINYLYAPLGLDASDAEILQVITSHKARVEAALDDSRGNQRVWAKYQWVAAYHDFFCDTWLPNLNGSAKISASLLRLSPRLLVQSPDENEKFRGPGNLLGLADV